MTAPAPAVGATTARALQIGAGAARALASPAVGTVEIPLGAGGYLRVGPHWILLAGPRAPLGPLSVLVAGLAPLRGGAPVRVRDDLLDIGELRIGLAGARLAALRAAPARQPGWRRALAAALANVPVPPDELQPGLAALRRDARAGAAALAGLGEGLTPAGDDVLAGFAAWRHAEGAPVRLDSARCSPLGAAYLHCAERGELPEPAWRVLHAVRRGDAAAAARRAAALKRWGASSGAAILWGMGAAA